MNFVRRAISLIGFVGFSFMPPSVRAYEFLRVETTALDGGTATIRISGVSSNGSVTELGTFDNPYGNPTATAFVDEYNGHLYTGGNGGYMKFDPASGVATDAGTVPSGSFNMAYPWNGNTVISDQGSGKIQIGNSTSGVTIDSDGIDVNGNPLINVVNGNEIHIGENSLITVEENGRQKLYAKDADGKAIPIDITEGSDLLINGTSVMGSIEENAEDIETNRKNINDLGYGVAGATALTAALSSLPIAADDAPFSCGVGTGGYSSRFAVGIGCASRLSDRLSVNVGGSHVFGGSSNYGGGSLDTLAARAGMVFKLGTIHKSSNRKVEQLQSQLDQVRQKSEESIVRLERENSDLLARLERLEAIALGTTPTSELATR